MKLRGRAPEPDQRRGRTISSGARGAKPTTPHGPLQRWLDGMELELNGPCLALPRRGDGIAPSPPPARQIRNVTNRRVSSIHAAEANDTTVRWLVRGTAQDLPRAVIFIVGYEQYGQAPF